MINIALILENALFRLSFKSFLESQGYFKVVIAAEVVESFEGINLQSKTTIVIFDLTENEERNLLLLQKFSNRRDFKTVALSSHGNTQQHFLLAKHFGMDAFFVAQAVEPDRLLDYLKSAMFHEHLEMYVDPSFKETSFIDWFSDDKTIERLSEREQTVLKYMIAGKRSHEIASELDLSIRTIESHRMRIMEKTGSTNMIGVILKAIKSGFFFSAYSEQ